MQKVDKQTKVWYYNKSKQRGNIKWMENMLDILELMVLLQN